MLLPIGNIPTGRVAHLRSWGCGHENTTPHLRTWGGVFVWLGCQSVAGCGTFTRLWPIGDGPKFGRMPWPLAPGQTSHLFAKGPGPGWASLGHCGGVGRVGDKSGYKIGRRRAGLKIQPGTPGTREDRAKTWPGGCCVPGGQLVYIPDYNTGL